MFANCCDDALVLQPGLRYAIPQQPGIVRLVLGFQGRFVMGARIGVSLSYSAIVKPQERGTAMATRDSLHGQRG